MTEHHPTYPSAMQALLLIALLMAIELFVAAAVFDADLLAGVNDGDVFGFITVVGNGILFVGLMAYKRMNYRALFHPAGHSLTATMTLVTVPICACARTAPAASMETRAKDSFLVCMRLSCCNWRRA